jgi:hypothetical protein
MTTFREREDTYDVPPDLSITDEIVNGDAATEGCSAPSFRPLRSCLRPPARSRGQGGAPGWTNDLDRGEDRGNVGLRWARVTAERRAEHRDWKLCRAA